jgi:hypothetical protein
MLGPRANGCRLPLDSYFIYDLSIPYMKLDNSPFLKASSARWQKRVHDQSRRSEAPNVRQLPAQAE